VIHKPGVVSSLSRSSSGKHKMKSGIVLSCLVFSGLCLNLVTAAESMLDLNADKENDTGKLYKNIENC
jgi:hypothetical protein